MMKFYRNETIEEIAEQRLLEFEQVLGNPLSPPIPIDLLGEQILGLSFLWDRIEELPGEVILGAIMPEKRLVVLNEGRRVLLEEKPGLERSTKGHEMGHWDLFVDKATLKHPVLFNENGDDGSFVLRNSPVGNVAVLKRLLSCEEGRKILREMGQRADEPHEARAVNRYAAAISMPRQMVVEEAQKIDRTKWPNLYRLSETFDVTISALVVRLKQLDLLYVRDKELFECRDHATGQTRLF